MSFAAARCAARVAAIIACLPIGAASAQDAFEIQVYEYELAPRGVWELETHLNHIARGVQVFDGTVAPTQGQTHLTFELTRGFTDYFETALYLVTARREGSAGDLVGWRLRPRMRFPESWFPVKVSISCEIGFPKDTYEANSMTFELRPIVEQSFGRVQVDVNPTVSKALRGPDAFGGWEFEPAARVALRTSRIVDLTLEYYGGTGPINNPLPAGQQVHQFFPGADLLLSKNVVWNVGVGLGATGAGNTVVYKMRLGVLFGD